MAKFNVGDVIIHIDRTSNYDRTVIGTTSDNQVVYEYMYDGRLGVGHGDERFFILKPVKKEGWMAIRSHVFEAGGRDSSLIYDTESQAKEKAARYNDVVAIVKVEWEEA